MDDSWIQEFVSGDYHAPGTKRSKEEPNGRDQMARRKAARGKWIAEAPNGTLTSAGCEALGMPRGCPVRVVLHDAGEWSGMEQPGVALVRFSSEDRGEWVKRRHVRTLSLDESRR